MYSNLRFGFRDGVDVGDYNVDFGSVLSFTLNISGDFVPFCNGFLVFCDLKKNGLDNTLIEDSGVKLFEFFNSLLTIVIFSIILFPH